MASWQRGSGPSLVRLLPQNSHFFFLLPWDSVPAEQHSRAGSSSLQSYSYYLIVNRSLKKGRAFELDGSGLELICYNREWIKQMDQACLVWMIRALELLPQRPLVFGAFVRQVICLCRLVVMEGDSSSVEEADVLSALLSSTATPSVLTHSDIDPCLCIIRPMPDGDSQVPSSQKESQQCENDIRGKQAWWESPPVGIRMI